MRNLIYLVFALALVSCGEGESGQKGATTENGQNGTAGELVIKGKINNANGRTLYLERFVNNMPTRFDSTVISSTGEFELTTAQLPLDFYLLSLAPDDACVVIFDKSNTSVHVQAEAGDMVKTYAVNGSPHTQLLIDFYRTADDFDNLVSEFKLEYEVALESNDTVRIMAVQDRMIDSRNGYYAYLVKFVTENPGSPACLSALQKLDIKTDFELFKLAATELRKAMPNSPYVSSLVSNVSLYEQQRAQEEQQAKLANLLNPGSEVPEINLSTPEGPPLALSSLRGKYVLIDFWASWCKPCRAENPNVVRMYNKYKNKGFDIYSVSLDKNKDAWVNAINQDGMTWKHVSDLAFWNSAAARTYGVSSIPFTVLIDKEGKVIATKLRGPALEAKLKEIFGF